MTSTGFFERHEYGERAILVHIDFGDSHSQALAEFADLVSSAGVSSVAVVAGTRDTPNPKYFVGSGKAAEIQQVIKEFDANIVLFNHGLSASQERNLEKLLNCRVLDRTGLILDIFAQRARSFEGKLQVELAQLKHLSTRLVRGWTHLERQKGGIGLRGPGETQLETDRRLIGKRIKQLQARLDKVNAQRGLSRQARSKAAVPTISLVGYTNAGKSTLFNYLTESSVYAADQLFATLDPTLRRIDLPGLGPAVLADTVGFIRDLPHDLVAAFRSTLQETEDADLLLHVVDVSDEDHPLYQQEVQSVLEQIDAETIPQLIIFNKIDVKSFEPHLEYNEDGKVERVFLSAHTGQGCDLLYEAITSYLQPSLFEGWLKLPLSGGRIRAKLYGTESVLKEQVEEATGQYRLYVRVSHEQLRAAGVTDEMIMSDAPIFDSAVAGVA